MNACKSSFVFLFPLGLTSDALKCLFKNECLQEFIGYHAL